MRKILPIIAILIPFIAFGQTETVHRHPEIEAMVNEISQANLETYIRGMVSSGTRHSLSEDQEGRGIEAARQYVLAQFQSFEKDAKGRLNASIDYFTVAADGRRIPEDVKMGNVMATLKGTDPNDDRIFIVSGHLDSRVSDVMDAKSDAPGANDDASGVAAVIEMARIMSKRDFSATIIFVAVSGEEQGLKGATHLAETAKSEGWNIAA